MKARALCLTLCLVGAGCRGDADRSPQRLADTIAPIGTGTELLLTRERLALLDDWIRTAMGRGRPVPRSRDDVRPPDDEASLYVPLERFLRDGWGREIEYHYRPDSRSYELRSGGEDGIVGTADDVVRSSAEPQSFFIPVTPPDTIKAMTAALSTVSAVTRSAGTSRRFPAKLYDCGK